MNRTIALIVVLILLPVSTFVVAEDDEFYYQIGGGLPMGPGAGGSVRTAVVEAGLSWNADLMCGDFDLELSIKNQLEGITGYYKQLMNNIVSAITGAIASLPALALQRANPALYDMFQNGVLQAKGEFRAAELSCEGIVDSMSTQINNEGWGSLAEGNYWRTLFTGGSTATADVPIASRLLLRAETTEPTTESTNNHTSDTAGQTKQDILKTEKEAEEHAGDAGVPWVGGTYRGGAGQAPLLLIRDTAVAGYNLLLARSSTDQSPPTAATCADAALCELWNTPVAAADWIVDVLGEIQIRTCTGCKQVEAQAGRGMHSQYQAEKNEIQITLGDLVLPGALLDQSALATVKGGEGYRVTRPLIEAIREEESPTGLVERLAGEFAISRTMEHALLARRVLLAGTKEPNIANNKLALEDIHRAAQELETEIEHMVFEIDVRQKMVSRTALMVLRRSTQRNRIPLAETAAPHTISEGASR